VICGSAAGRFILPPDSASGTPVWQPTASQPGVGVPQAHRQGAPGV